MYHNSLTLKSKVMKKQMNPDSYRDPGCGCGSGNGCCTGAMVD
jgi:hypothetical protein